MNGTSAIDDPQNPVSAFFKLNLLKIISKISHKGFCGLQGCRFPIPFVATCCRIWHGFYGHHRDPHESQFLLCNPEIPVNIF